jgi:5-methylcytosine-specific restriction endonuclease McrA
MGQFSDTVIQQVWEKATEVVGNDPNIWRKDFAGAWIRKDLYGTNTNYGWEIDHLNPISRGGGDAINNLYPLHWKNNRGKADNYPNFYTAITSEGVQNIERLQSWTAQ